MRQWDGKKEKSIKTNDEQVESTQEVQILSKYDLMANAVKAGWSVSMAIGSGVCLGRMMMV